MPVAIFTGGASWMSKWGAQRLLEEGWQVELFDRDTEAQDKVVAELGNANAVHSGELDVTDYEAVKEAFAGVAERHRSIDALVNCAGGMLSQGLGPVPFVETTPDYWDTILDANLKSVFNATHAALPYMKAQGKGAIVSISAGRGLVGGANANIYSAAKAGIILFSELLSGEVGQDGIRINAIAPGNAESRWKGTGPEAGSGRNSPLGRATSAEDVGNAIAFLISDKSSHVTGACIDVSGGTALY